MRQQGTVKFFNNSKGYGFITPDKGGSDVFVHVTQLPDGVNSLAENSKVEFEVVASRKQPGKSEAADVRLT